MNLLFLINIIALLFSFFVIGAILGAVFSKPVREKLIAVLHLKRLLLKKSTHNPILKPGTNPWTAEAVLNPAALELGNRTHLVYRAIGMDGVSRLGYASSPDGITFDDQLAYPAYVAKNPEIAPYLRRYSPVMYPSGGSWGGCEDPRMVAIDGRVYVTFNMFEKDWVLRVAVISMSEADFLAKHFYKWEGPIILSHGTRDKNWVPFPEKIGGRFAVLHSIIGDDASHVRVAYTDDLATLSQETFTSPDPLQAPDDQIVWHYRMRSAGPPRIRTEHGWLVLYHAMDPRQPDRYKLGAMLLDLEDPTKVLYRSAAPILSPDETYENHGKPGIIYACGTIVKDGLLYVYYGGADKVICVATTPLADFIDALITGSQPSLAMMTHAQIQ